MVHYFHLLLQRLGNEVPKTPYRGFSPGPHYVTSVPQTPYLTSLLYNSWPTSCETRPL